MKFDFSYLSEALNSVFGAKLYAWDRLYSYGILLGVVCVTFVIRKSVVKFFTHWLGLHKHEEVAPQGVTNFSQPLELAFIGVVAFITLKFLPSLPMEKQLSHFFWTLIVLAICWGVFRAIHMYSGKLEKIYAAFDKGLSKEIAKVVTDILRILTIVIGTFVVLDLWEINIAALNKLSKTVRTRRLHGHQENSSAKNGGAPVAVGEKCPSCADEFLKKSV